MRMYGAWSGRPDGYPEDTARCVAYVPIERSVRFEQCRRPRGKGPDGLYCGTHAAKLARGGFVRVPDEQ